MADDPRIEPVAAYLASQDAAEPLGDLSPLAQRYYTEQAEAALTAADTVDPLRALLADEQAAVAMIWRVIFDPGSRVRPGRTEPESVWRTRAVLAALREVANGTAR